MSWTSSIKLGSADPREIGARLINSGLGYLGIIVVVIVLWAGFKWMTSGGKDEKVTDAKKILINLIIGLVIILTAWSAVNFVIRAVSGATGAS